MDRKTKECIAVCPKHCDANFIADATVEQEWEVDPFGEMIMCRDEDMGTDLDYLRSWKCTKCRSTPKEVECIKIPVEEGGLDGNLLVPLDISAESYVFWNDYHTIGLTSYPIDCTGNVAKAAIKGSTLFLAAGDQMSEARDGVEFLVELGTDMILYLQGPRVECEGQISL